MNDVFLMTSLTHISYAKKSLKIKEII